MRARALGLPFDRRGLAASIGQQNALIAVAVGNSIATAAKFNGTQWTFLSELQWANVLSGGVMRHKRITASTRADYCGVYGYSSQTLATINGDLQAQFYDPLRTAGVVPDIVIGLALIENDLATGVSAAACIQRLTAWIRTVQTTWPGARILLCTPRLSYSYDSAAKVQAYQDVRDYMLALDDGYRIFTARCDSYEDPNSPGNPQYVNITGSISGTTLTVTASDVSHTLVGHYLKASGVTAATRITAEVDFSAGTYTVDKSQTVSSRTMQVPLYTDDAVHPQARGAVANARPIAAALRRIAASVKHPYTRIGTNLALTGSGAATGTNVSGTVPTSCTVTGASGGTFVSVAEDPGWLLTISNNAAGFRTDLSSANIAAITGLSGITELSAALEVEIVSGAENLRFVQLYPRMTDGGGNNFRPYLADSSADQDTIDWQNGDVLTFIEPPLVAASGSISTAQTYIQFMMKRSAGTNPTTLRFRTHGAGVVS